MKERVDRAMYPIKVGQVLKVQHCTGPYGQTRIVIGKLLKIDQYGGITLDRPDSGYGRGGVFFKSPTTYIAFPWTPDFDRDVMVGYSEHRDFEHGHTAWIEVVP